VVGTLLRDLKKGSLLTVLTEREASMGPGRPLLTRFTVRDQEEASRSWPASSCLRGLFPVLRVIPCFKGVSEKVLSSFEQF